MTNICTITTINVDVIYKRNLWINYQLVLFLSEWFGVFLHALGRIMNKTFDKIQWVSQHMFEFESYQ